MNCEQVRSSLLFYLDGELAPAERAQVEAHLATCPDCAGELARLRSLQAGLREAVPAGLAQLRLSAAAPGRIKARLRREQGRRSLPDMLAGRRSLWPALVRVAVPAFVAMCVLVTALVIPLITPVYAQETIVVAPSMMAPDTDAALRVIVREASLSRPVADAEITVRLRAQGEPSRVLYTGRTGAQGTADVRFHVPDVAQDILPADLIVETESAAGKAEVLQPVIVKRSFRVLLTSDKPLYRPGQTLHMRVLALKAGTEQALGLPAAGRPIVLTVHDPNGRQLFTQTQPASDYGIAAADYVLPADAPHGSYRLVATLGDTVSERMVTVGEYDRPSFKVEVTADRPYYLSGETVTGQVSVRQFDGEPLPGLSVRLRAYLNEPERRLVASLSVRTDAQGQAMFNFGLPALKTTVNSAALALEAVVTDEQGHVEWAGRAVPVAAEPLAIDLVPEGGRLRPGVENVLYILCTTPDGAPSPAQLELNIEDQIYTLSTDEYGLAQARFVPAARDIQVQVIAHDAQGRTVSRMAPLSADQGPAQVLLRLDRAAYEVGETMQVEALAGNGQAVYLDVVREGQTISTHILDLRDGRAQLALDVSPDMAGTLELHAYQVLADSTLVGDTRLAVVDAADPLQVRIGTDKASYAPGEVAHVTVDTALDDVPAQSAVGVAVVDESVFALEDRAPGFAKLFFLLQDALLTPEAQPRGVRLAELLDPTDAVATRAAQNVAARAAWANLPTSKLNLARGVSQARRAIPWWLDRLLWGLGGALLALTVALGIAAIRKRKQTHSAALSLLIIVLLAAWPLLWLSGCQPQTVIVKEVTVVEKQVTKEVVKEVEKQVTKLVEKEITKVVEKEVTKVVEKEITMTSAPAVQPSPTPLPTSAPTVTRPPSTVAPRPTPSLAATPRPTSAPASPTALPPAPPPLLGQFVPETIYWAPEAITDQAGHLTLDISLPDVSATWRLTVLASTRQGQLGAATTMLNVTD